jgi:hypothetical protein
MKAESVKCNCESFMTKGWCLDVMVFDLVEFNKTPPPNCKEVDGVSWERIRAGWKEKLLSTMFDEPGEEWHADNAHKTCLPDADPLFSFSSIIHSVPVPWQRSNPDATSRTLGLLINCVPKTQPGNFRAEIDLIPLNSSATTNVLVGDVIIKVNGVTFASNDGTLLHSDGNELVVDAVVAAIRKCPERHIVEMDVLRQYRLGRSVSPTSPIASVNTELDYESVNDNMHGTVYHAVSRLRSDGVAGGKTTGLYDSDHETGDAVIEESFNNDGHNEDVGY